MSETISKMTDEDKAIAQLKYAKDLISSGHLGKAKKAINCALSHIDPNDPEAVDNELLRLIKGGQ